MIIEPRRWECSCDQCNEELDCDDVECDGCIDDIDEFIRVIEDGYGWVYDADEDNVFCCQECYDQWKRDNEEDEDDTAEQ